MLNNETIKKALEVWPHQSLYYLANTAHEKNLNSQSSAANNCSDSDIPPQCAASDDENLLGCNIVTSLYIPYKQRGIQLNFSMRRLKKVTEELVSKEMIKEVHIGKNIFLAPTEKLFRHIGIVSPYKRCVSVDHSFAVLFAQYCIKADPMVQKTDIEVPVGNSGRTIDCVSYLKNGDRLAWEVTLNSSNVASNAAKTKDKGFSKIIFVCCDHNIRKSVKTIIDDAGFEPDFYSKIEYMLFSDLIHAKAERCK